MSENLVINISQKEAALRLWGNKFETAVILEICNISEWNFEQIVPRNLWYKRTSLQCPKCHGRGYITVKEQKKS